MVLEDCANRDCADHTIKVETSKARAKLVFFDFRFRVQSRVEELMRVGGPSFLGEVMSLPHLKKTLLKLDP